MIKTTSFVNADASKLRLYSGKATDGKYLYEKMDVFFKSNPEFYYITNTDAGLFYGMKDLKKQFIVV